MKRLILLILPLLLLGGCTSPKGEVPDFEAVQARLASETSFADFQRADDDFVTTNFGAPEFVQSSAVYFSDHGEIGLFVLSDTNNEADMRGRIENYLESEKSAVLSLAALYPARELEERLSRFEKAEIGAVGPLVYYLVLDDNLKGTAGEILGR